MSIQADPQGWRADSSCQAREVERVSLFKVMRYSGMVMVVPETAAQCGRFPEHHWATPFQMAEAWSCYGMCVFPTINKKAGM